VRLPATVPQVQCEISHELRMAMLDINGRTQTAYVLCDVVAEDYRAHGGFAGAALAHEQHLLFPFAGVHIGIHG
jgi:hypothetical protein